MRILTLENTTFELNKIPDSVDDTIRFSVLDNSNPKEPDFFFNPLIFLESFNSPAIVLNINNKEVQVLTWHSVSGFTSKTQPTRAKWLNLLDLVITFGIFTEK